MANELFEDVDANDEDLNAIAQMALERKRRLEPLLAAQAQPGIGQTIADLAVGLGSAFAGQSGPEAIQRAQASRATGQANILKALESQDVTPTLLKLSQIRGQRREKQEQREFQKEMLQTRLQLGLENQLQLLAAQGANAQTLQQMRQVGQENIAKIVSERRMQEQAQKLAGQKELVQTKEKAKGAGAGVNIEGLQVLPDTQPTSDDVKKVKKAKSKFDELMTSVEALKQKVNKYGLKIIPGEEKRLLQSDFADLKLKLKEAAALGALTGPDITILEESLPDPTSTMTYATLNKDSYLNVIKSAQDRMNQNFGSSIRAYGFSFGGQNVPRGTSDDARRKRLEELRAKYKGGQ